MEQPREIGQETLTEQPGGASSSGDPRRDRSRDVTDAGHLSPHDRRDLRIVFRISTAGDQMADV